MASLLTDIEQMSVAERLQLIQELWDSIAESPEQLPLTEAQCEELDRRLEAFRQNPDGGASWDEVKARMGT